jgi:hypothetical protein
VHWGAEIRARQTAEKQAAKEGKTGEDRYEIQRRKQEEENKRRDLERQRWEKAHGAIAEAIAAAVRKAPVSGLLGDLVVEQCQSWEAKRVHPERLVPRGKTAEDLVRHVAFIVLANELCDWAACEEFPKRAKQLGVDVRKIVDQVAPAKPETPVEIAKAGRENSKKAAKRKAA